MKAPTLILAMLCAAASTARADEYRLADGYVTLSGSGGVIRDLRVDPDGKGNYGPVIALAVYPGDLPAASGAPFEETADSVTVKNVPIYFGPKEVGLNEWDTPVRLEKGATLGQLFTVDRNGLSSVSIRVPTWNSSVSAMTLKLYQGGPGGKLVAEKRFENVGDNSWPVLSFAAQEKGTYYIEMSDPRGTVGWWTLLKGQRVGRMYEDGKPVDFGSRSFKAKLYDIFPARIRVSLVGPKLFAEAEPDREGRQFRWRMVTPFERDGFETKDPARIPFSRFYSDQGQYMPIAQLKRRSDAGFGMKAVEWVWATGNGRADVQLALENETMTWENEPDRMTLALGREFALTVKPHSDKVPDFYPAFYSSDPAFDASLNSLLYDRAFSWPMGGFVADWFEWLALVHFWNWRPGSFEMWRGTLLNYKIDDDGYVYTWGEAKGWPFPDNTKYDTRHFTTNSNFILACYRYFAWTGDTEFLKRNAERIRAAMRFMLGKLKASDNGIIVLPDKDHGGTPDDVASNYWDDLPFGGKSAYENIYYYAALGAMAAIETALDNHEEAKRFNDLRARCRKVYNELFWNDAAGRYVGCIDKNGAVHDYGFTYLNMEAATYGLAEKAQVERIYHWMEHEKTSSGRTDTYARFRFAPRVNTIDCRNWWYLNGKGEIPSQEFDKHLENGGAILYTSGYDIMARAKYLGADDAFKRLTAILERYEEADRLCGGAPLLYGENNGWQIGTDVPFPESGLVPSSFMYAFLGIQAGVEGLTITPNLPKRLVFAGVRNLRYRGMMLDVRVTRTSVTITCDEPKLRIEKTIAPGEGYVFTGPAGG